ncbi:MAG: hypothetical protein F9K40_11635 [Kofleriaceae bacterium]|nr:MAG: hypothetical protein F9K40_11635 [Kofleriaceae bacterium]MBZ0230950.1 hypothetical protein [Kofleriaceae bacterium]
MDFVELPVNQRAVRLNHAVEQTVNRAVRARDRLRARLGLRGRAADYDDVHYEFVGGANDEMRRKHYDKSLRLLWKAEAAAPWSTFRDLGPGERAISDMAEQSLTPAEREARAHIGTPEFRELLDRTYTPRQKQAIVNVLSAIGHGEAYAWLVSASNLRDVQSSGAKAAVTMQVVEEAKHFVVMRELVQAFGVPVPRQSAWEYLLLEGVLKADGLEKFYGMNVLVETIALSIFGALAHLPGLEILRLFHLDEARHTALPQNYFKEFPMTRRQQRSRRARRRRLGMALPTLPLVLLLEEDLAVLGIDAFDFAGSVLRKVSHLAERAGFLMPSPPDVMLGRFNAIFNAYCRLTRPGHQHRDFMSADTSRDAVVARVEHGIFAGVAVTG